MKNIEIKAKICNFTETEDKVKHLNGITPLTVIEQYDEFFDLPSKQKSSGARMKMRLLKDGCGELILYQRSNVTGPKLSDYSLVKFDAQKCKEMRSFLKQSNGVIGAVKKTRHLYITGQTRIHIDKVDGLGDFLELEVVLSDSDSISKGQEIAKNIMAQLEISEDSLISGAYMDLLLKKE